MALYVALHSVTPHMSADEAARLVYGVIQRLSGSTQWLRYWISDDEGKMICLWSADSKDAVWAIVRSAGVPTSDVFAVEEGDPSLFMHGLDAAQGPQ
jgi:hypothetical protein